MVARDAGFPQKGWCEPSRLFFDKGVRYILTDGEAVPGMLMPLVPSDSSRLEDKGCENWGEREGRERRYRRRFKETVMIGGRGFDLGGEEDGIDQHDLL